MFKTVLKILVIFSVCTPAFSHAESKLLCRIVAATKKISGILEGPKKNVTANTEVQLLVRKMPDLKPIIPLLNSLSFEGFESRVWENGQGITVHHSNLIDAEKPIPGGGRIRFRFDTHGKTVSLFFIFGENPETLLRLWNINRIAIEETYSNFPNKEDALEIYLRRKDARVPESYKKTSVGHLDTSSDSYPHNFYFNITSRSKFDVQLLQNLFVNIEKVRDNRLSESELTKDRAYYSLPTSEPGRLLDDQKISTLFEHLSDGISTWLDLPDGKTTQSEMADLRLERKQKTPAAKVARAIREYLAQRKNRAFAARNNEILQNYFAQGELIQLTAEDFRADTTENSQKFWHSYLKKNPDILGFKTKSEIELYSPGGRAQVFDPKTLLLVHEEGIVHYFQTNNHPVPRRLTDNPLHEGI